MKFNRIVRQSAARGMSFVALAFVLVNFSSTAMTIVPTYDSSVTGLTNASQIEAAFNLAAQTIEGLCTNPITVNLTVYWGTNNENGNPFTNGDGISLSASYVVLVGYADYSDLVSHLSAVRTTADARNAVAGLPGSDPTPGGSHWVIPRAEAKALNFTTLGVSPNDSTQDGSVGFAADTPFTFDATNRAVAGKSDFIGAAEHEITEVLGRTTDYLDESGNYLPYDLFRFTGNGVRSLLANDNNVYFSIDNGATNLKEYNPNDGGDIQDWYPTGLNDSFDAFANPGIKLGLSGADLIALNVLGYSLNYTPPMAAIQPTASTTVVLSFTNPPGMGLSIIETTNITTALSGWKTLGKPTENPIGQYQFTDPHATNSARYYRAVLK